jgi:outer membrane protein
MLRKFLLLLAYAGLLPAQPITVAEAVQQALRNYPAIRVSQEQMNAAAAGIRLAQTAYLPRVDSLFQLNRATRNTYYGLLLPQSIISSVDGVASNNFGTVWDSGAGVLVSWQPFDFGLREANVAAANAAHAEAQATLNRTRYEVSIAAADAFLTVLAAEQTAEAARAAVDSWQTLLRSIHALVAAELRPGADESRVQAELAAAQTQVAQAEAATAVARSTLALFVGGNAEEVPLNAGRLLAELPAERPEPALNAAANPLARQQTALIAQQQKQIDSLSRTWYPQFLLQGEASARGTGLVNNGSRLGGLNGLAPTTQNFGIGLTVTFPVMDRYALEAQEAQEAANLHADQTQYQVITTNLEAQFRAARANLAGARRVAANTPVQVAAGRAALEQATARYRSGLAPIDDVAQAQRLLVQALIDDSLARLNVWRAQLQLDSARGDVQPFLAAATP